jgi:hypothetical protein
VAFIGRINRLLRENALASVVLYIRKGGDWMSGVNVKSTSLRSVQYDTEKRVLQVELHAGELFQYFDVPAKIYEELLAAESQEQYFDWRIRLKFRHRRVLQI